MKRTKGTMTGMAVLLAGVAIAQVWAASAVVMGGKPVHGTNLWHYAQMDFELYRLEAMRDEARRAGMSVDHPGRLPEWRKFAFRIRCDAAARPPFRTAHVASSDWKDGYLTVTTDGGWRDVGALCSPVRGWEAQTFDGVWRPAATYLGGETPPHRDDLPEDRTFAGLVATNGCYDAGAEVLAYVECAAAAEPKLFVGESLPELAEESLSRMEQLPRLRRVADGRWRTETALAFRYLRFRGGAVSDVKVVPVGWPLTERGTFASSNPRHGRLREVGARTLRLCALDFLVDGIKRDRLPWGGDLAVSLLADAYVFGDAEIVRRSLSVLDAFEGDVNGIVTYSMWLVVCHDLYQLYFGDRAFLDARWWRVKARVEDLVSRTDGRGFVVKDIKWAFVDWTGPESRTAVQAIWAGALDAAARLADRVKDVRAVDYRALAAKVRKSLNAAAWDEARGLYRVNPDATSAFSRQPNVYAVVFGVADAAKARRIGAELAKDELPPVGTPYVRGWELVALNRAGFHTAFLDGLERTFGAMLDAGATTYWEGLDVAETGDARYAFYGRPWGKSLCHAWSAWPAFLFVSEAMGVKPTADGWATCEAKPIPGAEGMRATVPTPHGVRAFGPESAAAFVMRFDDNKPVAHWREVAEIFEAVGGRCSFAVNAASLSEEQWAALRDLSARGHEIMDHTAQHAVFLLPAATDAEAAAHRAAAFFDHAEQGGRLVFCRPEIDLADSGNVRVRAAMTNGVLRSSDPAFLRLQGVGRKFHVPSVGKTYGFGTSCGYGLFKKGPEQRCSDFWGRWTNDSFGPREIVILADAAVQPSLDLLRAQARASVSRFVAHGLPSPKTWIRPGGWEGGVDGRRMKAVYGDEFGYAVADSTLAQGLPKGSPWRRRSDFEFFDRVPDVDKVYRRMADVLARGQSFAYISHQWTKDRAQFLEQCRAFAARLKAGGIRLTTYSHIAEGQTRVMQSK